MFLYEGENRGDVELRILKEAEEQFHGTVSGASTHAAYGSVQIAHAERHGFNGVSECELLIPQPIPSYYRIGIGNALMFRRNNPGFFVCNAIDVVLTYYLNNYYPEDNDVFR